MTKKHEVVRPYPPDYNDAETLAYRLSIFRSSLDDRVAKGQLPSPCLGIPGFRLWYWPEVHECIQTQNKLASEPAPAAPSDDPFIEGLKRGATEDA